MGKLAKGFVVMLDIDRVLASSEVELAAVAAAAAAAANGAAGLDELPATHPAA